MDADIALLDDITTELYEKSKMIWPDSLVLIVPFIKQYPEIKVLSDNVKSFKSIINRHTQMLIPHIDDYLSGNHHERVCQLISNYLPYFYGANVRLIETINNESQFNKNYSCKVKKYFSTLNVNLSEIEKNLHSIIKELNKITFILRPFASIKNDSLELKWYENRDIWTTDNEI